MTPAVEIFFDTSALRELGWNSAPLSSVLELSKAGLVEVYLPELVVEERRTQWAEAPRQALEAARSALRSLVEDPILPSSHSSEVQQALESISKLDIERMSAASVEEFLQSNRINQIPLTFEHSKAAWKAYFTGAAPHRKPKTRDDIPDAHIFQAAKSLLKDGGSVHFICADKRLAGALRPLEGAIVHENLEELFQSGALADATHLWDRDRTWRRIQHLVAVDALQAEVRALFEEDLDDHLVGIEFEDPALPGDETVAHVLWAMGGELVSVENPDDWGGGLLTFAVECECDAGIGMTMSHEDAHRLPDWLDVSWGHGSSVDVTASVRLKVEASVDVEVNLLNGERGLTPLLSKADFDQVRLFIIPT